MFNIEYDIDLNENKRPYIVLPETYKNNPEDRFFSTELARYVLQDVYYRKKDSFSEDDNNKLEQTINILGQISDEIAKILYGEMKRMGDVQLLINPEYHVQVETKKERNNLPDKDIFFNKKIYDKCDGLKVLVTKENNIYEYKNNKWLKKTSN